MRRPDVSPERLKEWVLVAVLCVAVGAAVPIGIALLSGAPWTASSARLESADPTPAPVVAAGSPGRATPGPLGPSASASGGVTDIAPGSSPTPRASATSRDDRPVITRRVPAPGATTVPRGTSIEVVFSAPVRRVSGDTVRLINIPGGWPVRATVRYVGSTHTIVLDPALLMYRRTTYRVEIGPGITDQAGHRLAPASWTFRSGG